MEGIYYTRELNRNYMCIPTDNHNNNYQMNMLINNNIPGIMKVLVRSINNKTIYFYDITSLTDFNTYYSKDMLTGDNIKSIITGIDLIITASAKYLLNIDNFILDCEYIYNNINTGELVFCYYDGYNAEFVKQIRSLFEYLMQKISHNDECAVILTYGIYRRICAGETDMKKIFSFEEINESKMDTTPVIEEKETINQDILPEVHKDEEESVIKNKLYAVYAAEALLGMWLLLLIAGAFYTNIDIVNGNVAVRILLVVMILTVMLFIFRWYMMNQDSLYEIVQKERVIPYASSEVSIAIPVKTESAEHSDRTVLLSEEDSNRNVRLKWTQDMTDKFYEVTELPFVIGSLADKADCIISLPGISRIHARISGNTKELYIKDLNSTNGTFVDGRRLACYELCKIDKKSEILIGITPVRIV